MLPLSITLWVVLPSWLILIPLTASLSQWARNWLETEELLNSGLQLLPLIHRLGGRHVTPQSPTKFGMNSSMAFIRREAEVIMALGQHLASNYMRMCPCNTREIEEFGSQSHTVAPNGPGDGRESQTPGLDRIHLLVPYVQNHLLGGLLYKSFMKSYLSVTRKK